MKAAILTLIVAACNSSVQGVMPPIVPPAPKTVVIIEHDSSPGSRSKYLDNIRPEGRVKVDPMLPWIAEYKPPTIYAEWWQEIGKCEKLEMPVELTKKVKFVEVNSETFRIVEEEGSEHGILGLTDPESLTIFIAQGRVNDKSVVEHEMAHQGAVWNGYPEGADYHPYNIFEECKLHVTDQ